MKKQTKKILIYSIAIITILAISLVIILFSGILQGMIQVCGNDCKPYYQKFGSGCYQSCGISNSDGTKISNCDTQGIINYYKQYMPNVQVFSDSQCTNLLSDYKCTPNWKCNGFTSCSKSKNGIQTRTCRDLNNCGNDLNKPEETRLCKPTCIPNCSGKCGGVSDGCTGRCNNVCPKVDKIAVVYVYKNTLKDKNWKLKLAKIDGTRLSILTGKSVQFNILNQPIKINFNYPNDFNKFVYSTPNSIIKELSKNSQFMNYYNNNDGIMIVLDNTYGGCQSYDYKSPIFCNSDLFTYTSSKQSILITHEILHDYGLKDYCKTCPAGIPSGCEKDIMGNLDNPNNYLCSQSKKDLKDKIGKHTLSYFK